MLVSLDFEPEFAVKRKGIVPAEKPSLLPSFSAGITQMSRIFRTISELFVSSKLPDSWTPFQNGEVEVAFNDRITFAEDVVLDHEYGVAIISCDPGRPNWNTVIGPLRDPNSNGKLFLYDYASSGKLDQLTLVGFNGNFHPLRVNFFRDGPGGLTRLFVVDHGAFGRGIMIFDVDYAKLEAHYVGWIYDGRETIVSPNAICPVSYTQFYVTNDHYYIKRRHPFLSFYETMFSRPWGWVTFVDFTVRKDTKCRVVATNIPFANGIVMPPTGTEVLMASTSADAVLVYQRDPGTNELSEKFETIPLPFMRPYNLRFDFSLDRDDSSVFDADGKFLRGVTVAGHPLVLEMEKMSRNPDKYAAPSWVVEIRRGSGDDPAPCSTTNPENKSGYFMRTLYQGNGKDYPSSTTGALDSKRKRLIVSGLYAKGLLSISYTDEEPSSNSK
ncbi:hypothetical protein AJ80_00230 [Polytolypa hystricis UAMH7299]|uniref:SMP-30/Gluconolactonase/LRE-like region domain-containing protein n=1 Tax=Polytolypa hystricis (strain UAMH7299) TaxID=1447883 RepID=A0A2B7Z215_POLH7|nr:hypothetical protein AJ80_00230 [Polytolypa hystricis UAMH7299]